MTNTISSQEAAQLLASGDAILIDVREADEFKDEHIAYANSLPLSRLEDLFIFHYVSSHAGNSV